MADVNIALSITKIYPDLQPFVDFRCVCEEGIQSIAEWHTDKPQPTDQQIQDAWIQVCKDEKKAALSQQCNVAIMSGFESSALGETHIYPSDTEAQLNFNSTMNRFLTDPTFVQINFKTLDAGYLTHTKDQFYMVFSDGHAYVNVQITHLNDLRAKIDAAQSIEELENVTWQ